MSEIKSVDDLSEDMIGEKMYLKRDDDVNNKFCVVRLKSIEEDYPVLETDKLGGGEVTPLLGSWYLEEFVDQELKEKIPVGEYYVSGGEILDSNSIDYSKIEPFEGIEDKKVVLRKSEDGWEKVN